MSYLIQFNELSPLLMSHDIFDREEFSFDLIRFDTVPEAVRYLATFTEILAAEFPTQGAQVSTRKSVQRATVIFAMDGDKYTETCYNWLGKRI